MNNNYDPNDTPTDVIVQAMARVEDTEKIMIVVVKKDGMVDYSCTKLHPYEAKGMLYVLLEAVQSGVGFVGGE